MNDELGTTLKEAIATYVSALFLEFTWTDRAKHDSTWQDTLCGNQDLNPEPDECDARTTSTS